MSPSIAWLLQVLRHSPPPDSTPKLVYVSQPAPADFCSDWQMRTRDSDRPLSTAELRAPYPARKATLYARLTQLTANGQLVRCTEGYRLAPNNPLQTSS